MTKEKIAIITWLSLPIIMLIGTVWTIMHLTWMDDKPTPSSSETWRNRAEQELVAHPSITNMWPSKVHFTTTNLFQVSTNATHSKGIAIKLYGYGLPMVILSGIGKSIKDDKILVLTGVDATNNIVYVQSDWHPTVTESNGMWIVRFEKIVPQPINQTDYEIFTNNIYGQREIIRLPKSRIRSPNY